MSKKLRLIRSIALIIAILTTLAIGLLWYNEGSPHYLHLIIGLLFLSLGIDDAVETFYYWRDSSKLSRIIDISILVLCIAPALYFLFLFDPRY